MHQWHRYPSSFVTRHCPSYFGYMGPNIFPQCWWVLSLFRSFRWKPILTFADHSQFASARIVYIVVQILYLIYTFRFFNISTWIFIYLLPIWLFLSSRPTLKRETIYLTLFEHFETKELIVQSREQSRGNNITKQISNFPSKRTWQI